MFCVNLGVLVVFFDCSWYKLGNKCLVPLETASILLLTFVILRCISVRRLVLAVLIGQPYSGSPGFLASSVCSRIVLSPNHRIVEVGRHLRRSSYPSPCSSRVT